MASSNQKSFLSHVVLDSSKIKESFSTSILPPLHTGQCSYIVYKHKLSSKNSNHQLPFGSTSSRVIQQLQPKISTHVVSYQSDKISQKKNESRLSPFGSTQNRFKQIKSYSPGPGIYQNQKLNTIEHSRSSCIFGKDSKDLKNEGEKQNLIGPGSYQVAPIDHQQYREKIAQKYRDHKRKYIQNLIRISKKHQQEIKPINCIQQPLISPSPEGKQRLSYQKRNATTPINRFILKDHTKKYMMKEKQENNHHIHQNEPSCSIYNNFTYNFIEKYDDAFSSYIPKQHDTPGPGYYPQKQLKQSQAINQSFTFKSSSARNVFPITKSIDKKQKTKLSQLL